MNWIYIKKLFPAPCRKIKLYRGTPSGGWQGNSGTRWRPFSATKFPMIVEALEIATKEGRVTTRSEMGEREQYIYLRISEEEAIMLLFQPSFLTIQKESR